MTIPDTAALAQLILMLGLVKEEQLRECRNHPDHVSSDPASLLRILGRQGYLTPWQIAKLQRGERDGFFLGDYRLLYLVAQGSFGRVFRADDPKSGIVVAIKVLRKRWNDSPHSVELFLREARVGLTLRHPHIVQILALDQDPATQLHYIVMEFVEGGSLKDFLAIRKKVPPGEALRLTEECASALAHAYSKGMTHRDLKLTNILVSSEGKAKLVDFGLACVTTGEEDTRIERTVDYAGLEKATGTRPGDVRSDIYFLGCVLYELLTGRPPLEPTKDRAVRMQAKRYSSVPPMLPEETAAPPVVFRLVEKMMAFNPMERFQVPAQLMEAVRTVRRDLEGGKSGMLKKADASAAPRSGEGRTVFVVEQHEKLQEAIRNRLKEGGFRVLLSGDPAKALMRFQHQPYDAVIVDAGSVGEEGVTVFRDILNEAQRHKVPCAGVLILSENQADWAGRILKRDHAAVLVRPVTLNQLHDKLYELMGLPAPEAS
jgi:serine/threonine protein kinase